MEFNRVPPISETTTVVLALIGTVSLGAMAIGYVMIFLWLIG